MVISSVHKMFLPENIFIVKTFGRITVSSKIVIKLNFGVVMVTHDISEAFKLGTRVLVFDKVKEDKDFPNRYGSTIVNDIDASKKKERRDDKK